MIDFKNLIVGSHESKVLFTWNVDHDAAMLGAFLGIEDGIESILARDETTPGQRAILEEFRDNRGKEQLGLRGTQTVASQLIGRPAEARSFASMRLHAYCDLSEPVE